jgi:hypothetical protein
MTKKVHIHIQDDEFRHSRELQPDFITTRCFK